MLKAEYSVPNQAWITMMIPDDARDYRDIVPCSILDRNFIPTKKELVSLLKQARLKLKKNGEIVREEDE